MKQIKQDFSFESHGSILWVDGCQKSTYSEYGHVAYQIKRNEAYNNILANVLPLHTPLTSGVGSKVIFSFSECSHVSYQIIRNEA